MQHYEQRNVYMLKGSLKRKGYDWWWHSFTGINRQTGEQKAFFIEYFIINPARSPQHVVMGNGGLNRPSYVMIKAGTWGKDACQMHAFYPTGEMHQSKRKLEMTVGPCCLSEKILAGKVEVTPEEAMAHPEWMSDAGSMTWNLKLDKKITFNPGYCTNWLFRSLKCAEMFWHAQGIKTEYSGFVIYNGQEYIVTPERSFGYADKNWGKDFTNPWIWLSSCHLVSQISGKRLADSAFDIGGGCPKLFGIKLPRRVLVCFSHEGKKYEYNFTHFWRKSKITFNFFDNTDILHWTLTAEDKDSLLDVDIYCPKSESLFIKYENPMGIQCFKKLWNCGTASGKMKLFKKNRKALELLEDVKVYNCGAEYGTME